MSATLNFDRLAPLYRWMEYLSLGPYLALTREAYLRELGGFQHALVLGDGDGRFTARLLRANPRIRIDAVDCSAAMLASLCRRAGQHADRVRTHQTDLRDSQPDVVAALEAFAEPYDLVVSHFFLDCLTTQEIERLSAKILPVLAPDAHWLVSEFTIPHGWFGLLIARPLVSALYLAFGWMTGLEIHSLPDHRTALRTAGFALVKERTRLNGILVSEFWRKPPLSTE